MVVSPMLCIYTSTLCRLANIPSSGHCQRFAPKFDTAAKTIADAKLDAKLGKVDCTAHKNFCAQKGIRAYPTMKIYKQGKELYHEYTGPRRASA
jgi:protein disulfide-isomerase A1